MQLVRVNVRAGGYHGFLFAKVDEEDYPLVSRYCWHLMHGYAVTSTGPGRKRTHMHRLINQTPDGLVTDHINHDRLDNRRANLRSVTNAENARNVARPGYFAQLLGKEPRCPFKGVRYAVNKGKWLGRFEHRHLGYFATEREAALAFDLACFAKYRDPLLLNFPELVEQTAA